MMSLGQQYSVEFKPNQLSQQIIFAKICASLNQTGFKAISFNCKRTQKLSFEYTRNSERIILHEQRAIKTAKPTHTFTLDALF